MCKYGRYVVLSIYELKVLQTPFKFLMWGVITVVLQALFKEVLLPQLMRFTPTIRNLQILAKDSCAFNATEILFLGDSFGEEGIPDDVVQYLVYFKRMVEEENVAEIHSLYEHGFPDLTERFFQQKLWPGEEAVENIVGSGKLCNYFDLFGSHWIRWVHFFSC